MGHLGESVARVECYRVLERMLVVCPLVYYHDASSVSEEGEERGVGLSYVYVYVT